MAERPRLLFEEKEEEGTDGVEGGEAQGNEEEVAVTYSSLKDTDEEGEEREGGEWIDHQRDRDSPTIFNEDKERPSMQSTAGKGVFARYYNMSPTTNFTFKVVFLGDPSVGKTCVAKLYISRKQQRSTQSTIAFDCQNKDVVIDGVPSTLQIWDTAGMEQFRRGLITQYYRNVNGVVFVYDITRRESFVDVREWLGELRQYCRKSEHVQLALLANKCDLEEERQVPTDEGRHYAEENGMIFAEISTVTDTALRTLDSVFERLSSQMLSSRQENSLTRSMVEQQRGGGNIRLDQDWVVIDEFPRGPFPSQDNQRQRTFSRQDLEQSFRKVFKRPRMPGSGPRLPFRNNENGCSSC